MTTIHSGFVLLALLFAWLPVHAACNPRFEATDESALLIRSSLAYAKRLTMAGAEWRDGETWLIAPGGTWTMDGVASHLIPQLVASAKLVDRSILQILRRILYVERRRLPDELDLTTGNLLRTDSHQRQTTTAVYAAEVLLPIVRMGGSEEWSNRLREVVDDIYSLSPVFTNYSDLPLPSGSAEVNGQVLRTLTTLREITGDERYIDRARAIQDAYCLGVLAKNGGLPAAHWNFGTDRAKASTLHLGPHGLPILEGLVDLHAYEQRIGSERARIYQPILAHMFDTLLQRARDPSGIFYARINPDGRGSYSVPKRDRSVESVRLIALMDRFGATIDDCRHRKPAAELLRSLSAGKSPVLETSDEAWPRSVPYLLNILSRSSPNFPGLGDAWERLHTKVQNLASAEMTDPLDQSISIRAVMSYARHQTAGIGIEPWDPAVSCGGVAVGDTLWVSVQADEAWKGRIHLPFGEFSDRSFFRVTPGSFAKIHIENAGASAIWHASVIRHGIPISISEGQTYHLIITKEPETPEDSDGVAGR